MNSNQRDPSVDIIKGFACILMLCAHLPALQIAELGPRVFVHLCGLATALFFATAGVTASFQASKYKPRALFIYFFLILIFGTSWNILIHGNSSAFQVIEIFQVIALGSLLVCMLEWKGNKVPQYLLLLTAIIISCLKFAADMLVPEFDGLGLLLPSNSYVPHHLVLSIQDRVWPGFALFPWLFVFPLGIFCYRASKGANLFALICALIVLLLADYLGSIPIEKWDVSVAYLAQLYMYVFLAFWFMKGAINKNYFTDCLEWIGKNIIIFFFTHPLAIIVGAMVWKNSNIYFAWLMTIISAIFLTYIFSKIKPLRVFERKLSWFIMAIVLLASPFLSDITHNVEFQALSRIIALLVGIIFAVNVSYLSAIVKGSRHKMNYFVE